MPSKRQQQRYPGSIVGHGNTFDYLDPLNKVPLYYTIYKTGPNEGIRQIGETGQLMRAAVDDWQHEYEEYATMLFGESFLTDSENTAVRSIAILRAIATNTTVYDNMGRAVLPTTFFLTTAYEPHVLAAAQVERNGDTAATILRFALRPSQVPRRLQGVMVPGVQSSLLAAIANAVLDVGLTRLIVARPLSGTLDYWRSRGFTAQFPMTYTDPTPMVLAGRENLRRLIDFCQKGQGCTSERECLVCGEG